MTMNQKLFPCVLILWLLCLAWSVRGANMPEHDGDTLWLGNLVVGVQRADGKMPDVGGMEGFEIGLRSDGVLVWRKP